MPTIALLTFHHSLNYGANLQTYATCKLLKELGYKVVIIDLRIEESLNWKAQLLFMLKKLRFAYFRYKYYPRLTRHYNTINQLKQDPPHADLYMVGSDQTWNPELTRHFTEAFFLNFGDRHIPRIGFSVSFGADQWNFNNLTSSLSEYVHQFKALSTREKRGTTLCSELFSYKAEWTLDPTLLHPQYPELTKGITLPINPKIVSYKFATNASYIETLKTLGIKNHKSIQILGTIRPIKGIPYTYPVGIPEWIRIIAQADCILTDSFHGVAFSILYQKKFIAFISDKPSRANRITSLLEAVGLTDRLYCQDNYDINEINRLYNTPIKYTEVSSKLAALRQQSIDFLQKNLSFLLRS